MKFIKDTFKSLTIFEICLWIFSSLAIIIPFFALKNTDYLTLVASLIGVCSLTFLAKGNWIGQALMIIFATIYGIISFKFKYYGELITYVGMTLPIALISMISWIKNSYNGSNIEVKINRISIKEYFLMLILGIIITIIFYFILNYYSTRNLIFSTISIFTSFIASYFEIRRSKYYAIGFMLNDLILIILWILATIENINYLSIVLCFATFFINDLYAFINWNKMQKRQNIN